MIDNILKIYKKHCLLRFYLYIHTEITLNYIRLCYYQEIRLFTSK
jgi:hypothetical protein